MTRNTMAGFGVTNTGNTIKPQFTTSAKEGFLLNPAAKREPDVGSLLTQQTVQHY